ncbi:MAG: Gfo/Idh/MocA family protein [Acutalibacteraceae bacterium]
MGKGKGFYTMQQKKDDSIRLGIIGSSWISCEMIRGAKSTGFFTLEAVYSRTKERAESFAREQGALHTFTSLQEMAASPLLDAVYIASPNVCHVEQCRLFLQNGKHVLCEKPLAARGQEVMELQKLAREKGVIYMEAIMMLHLPWREKLRRAVRQIGPISLAKFDFCQYSSKYDGFLQGRHQNIFDPAMETGALMDLGVYTVYPALWLFGEPMGVTAAANFLPGGADGSGTATLLYPDKLVVLTYSKTGASHTGGEIVGEKGTIHLPSISTLLGMALYRRGKEPEFLSGQEEKYRLMGYEARQFAQWINEGPDEAYEDASRLAVQVALLLHQIRRMAGIHFAGDETEQLEKPMQPSK